MLLSTSVLFRILNPFTFSACANAVVSSTSSTCREVIWTGGVLGGAAGRGVMALWDCDWACIWAKVCWWITSSCPLSLRTRTMPARGKCQVGEDVKGQDLSVPSNLCNIRYACLEHLTFEVAWIPHLHSWWMIHAGFIHQINGQAKVSPKHNIIN